jgi:hypothetical protein
MRATLLQPRQQREREARAKNCTRLLDQAQRILDRADNERRELASARGALDQRCARASRAHQSAASMTTKLLEIIAFALACGLAVNAVVDWRRNRKPRSDD